MRTPSSTSSTDRFATPRLPSALARRLALPRSLARGEGVRLFLVGGAVRDLLLGLPVRDIDLAVEGDAVGLARKVAQALGRRAQVHGRFGTATVELGRGERLDFAATRREEYERPGALPKVSPAAIEEDLFRRDFTINAMAIELATARARLLDPFGGRDDLLGRRRLRVLHPRSFQDDPTRAYRAARYANRLMFHVETSTRTAVEEAVAESFFDSISGDRRRREVRLLFSELGRAGALKWMRRLSLTRTLHPALQSDSRALARLRSVERLEAKAAEATTWFAYLLAWAGTLTKKEAVNLADRLSLVAEQRRALCHWPETLGRLARPLPKRRPSALAELRLSGDELVAAAVCSVSSANRSFLARFLARPSVSLAIRGRDLVRAGVPPGPAIGLALQRTLSARQDGRIPAERELEFAVETARGERP